MSFEKKVFEAFGISKNLFYLCTRFRFETEAGSEKRVLKKVSKKFGDLKNLIYLCNRFRLKNESRF